MIDILKGAWLAGETKTFHVNGSYFEILECAYPIDVKLLDKSGAVRSDMRQAEASFFSEGLDFQTIQITSALAQNIRSFYGDGTAGTRRTAGLVSVVDASKARTLASTAFVGAGTSPATAGQNSMVQLWNPGGSGVNLVLENLKFTGTAAAGIDMGAYITALANLGTTNSPKLIGSATAAKAEVRNQANAGTLMTKYMIASYMTALAQVPFEFREPIVIPPGAGFLVANASQNSNLTVTFEWLEDLI